MSPGVGVATSSKGMGFDDTEANIQLGPQSTLKELSDKNKFERWKDNFFGSFIWITGAFELEGTALSCLKLHLERVQREPEAREHGESEDEPWRPFFPKYPTVVSEFQ